MGTIPETSLDWIKHYPTKSAVEHALQNGYTPKQIVPVLRDRLQEVVGWYDRFASGYHQRAWESRVRGNHEESYKFEENMRHHRQSAQEQRREIGILETDGLDGWLLTQPSI